jgi:hypothetical protein
LDWLGANIISTALKELNILWPGSLSIISEDPSLVEFGSSLNFMFVRDAFLYEACLITWIFLGFGCWLWLWLLSRLLFLDEDDLCWKSLIHLDVLVLADELCWGKFRLSDLEQGMSSMNSITLTCFANIVIGAN